MTHIEPANVFTRHARKRMQQRSIPVDLIDLLFRFGDCRDARHGADSYYFTKRSWRQVESYLGTELKAFERYRNVYAIVADRVMTVAHRH